MNVVVVGPLTTSTFSCLSSTLNIGQSTYFDGHTAPSRLQELIPTLRRPSSTLPSSKAGFRVSIMSCVVGWLRCLRYLQLPVYYRLLLTMIPIGLFCFRQSNYNPAVLVGLHSQPNYDFLVNTMNSVSSLLRNSGLLIRYPYF
jgi:hypothetical protein